MGRTRTPPGWLAGVREGYQGSIQHNGRNHHIVELASVGDDFRVSPRQKGARLLLRCAGVETRVKVLLEGPNARDAIVVLDQLGSQGASVAGVQTLEVSLAETRSYETQVHLGEDCESIGVRGGGTFNFMGTNEDSLTLTVFAGHEDTIELQSQRQVSQLLVSGNEGPKKLTINAVTPDFRSVNTVEEVAIYAPDGLEGAYLRTGGSLRVETGSVEHSNLRANDITLQGPRQRYFGSRIRCHVGNGSRLVAPHIEIHGDVGGGEKRVFLEASSSIVIDGDCVTADVRGEVVDGMQVRAQDGTTQPVSEKDVSIPDSFPGLAGLKLINRQQGRAIRDSSIQIDGALTVEGDVKESLITCGAAVVVAGDLQLDGRPLVAESLEVGDSLLSTTGTSHVAVGALSVAGRLEGCHVELDRGSAVVGEVMSSTLVAGTIRVLGDARGESELVSVGGLALAGHLDEKVAATVGGNLILGSSSSPSLNWVPNNSSVARFEGKSVSTILLAPEPGSLGQMMTLVDESSIGKLIVSVEAKLTIDLSESASGQRHAPLEPVNMLEILAGGRVIYRGANTREISGGRWLLGKSVSIESDARRLSIEVGVRTNSSAALSLRTRTKEHWIVLSQYEPEEAEHSFDGALRVRGYRGRLHVLRDLEALMMPEAPDFGLRISNGATVRKASGSCRLHGLDGKLFADTGKKVTVNDFGENIVKPSNRLAGGVIVGADLHKIEDSKIRLLAALRVLEVHRKSMRQAAKAESRDRAEAHAQRMRDIADIVTDRAVTGGSRASARWAAIHAAAGTLTNREWLERFWRKLHRVVFGYGYSPGPPALSLAGWLSILALTTYWLDPGPDQSDQRVQEGEVLAGEYGLWDQVQRALLMPLQVLRYAPPGSDPYAPYFDSQLCTAAIAAVTALLVAGLIVALKNYLRSPHNRTVEADDLL